MLRAVVGTMCSAVSVSLPASEPGKGRHSQQSDREGKPGLGLEALHDASPRSGQAEGLIDHPGERRVEEHEEQQIGEPSTGKGRERSGPADAM